MRVSDVGRVSGAPHLLAARMVRQRRTIPGEMVRARLWRTAFVGDADSASETHPTGRDSAGASLVHRTSVYSDQKT